MSVPKRIVKEVAKLMKSPPPGISVSVGENNLRSFNALIQGPPGSPYEGGVFDLEVYLTSEYPMKPPKIRFKTKIYHPNIDKIGRICLDILKSEWTPALQVRTVLLSIQALMGEPNVDDPLDEQVAHHWRTDKEGALKEAKQWTTAYATKQ